MRSPGIPTTRFTSRVPPSGEKKTTISPRLGSLHLAMRQVVKGTFKSYASLLTKIRSPSRIVGFMDPVGTSFQSAMEERKVVSTTAAKRKGRSEERRVGK